MPAMTTSDIVFLRKLAEIKRSGQFKISMEQLRRLEHIKQGQFTATITEEEEPMPPKFLTDIQDAEVKNLDCTLWGEMVSWDFWHIWQIIHMEIAYNIIQHTHFTHFLHRNLRGIKMNSPIFNCLLNYRVIFIEDHIPTRPDRIQVFGWQTPNGMWSSMKITL